MSEIDLLVKGALLHDIGKVCIRADRSLGNHSNAGVTFLQKFLDDSPEAKKILRCVKFHHSSALKNASIADNDISYLVYEADNISAAADRRENEGEDKGFNASACLQSVFNIFGEYTNKPLSCYYLRGMNPKDKFNYPTTENCMASDDKYQDLVELLRNNFQTGNIMQMSNNELLRILEDVMSFVPSSTNNAEVGDISLFIHSKITAAIASCMYQYLKDKGINDFKRYCYSSENKTFRQKETFLLVSGDFSGIQNFIYTIPSKGALKNLRGRSFYLELFMENYIDELLTELHLSRANLIYAGGGHFYLLAANTDNTKAALKRMHTSCNQWMLDNFGTQLYMAMGYTQCSADDLRGSETQRNAFAVVSKELNKDKLCRYNEQSLEKLFDCNSIYNKNIDGSRECAVCHMSAKKLEKSNTTETYVCSSCNGLSKFGEILFNEGNVFAVLNKNIKNNLEIFGFERKLYLAVLPKQKLEEYKNNLVRIYSKNEALTGNLIGTRLWLADYLSRKENDLSPFSFNELAEQCCDDKHGIKRLGVLRADVDNLGAAFIGGFRRNTEKDSEKYATLSRYADLSRDLGLFFKLAVAKICKGDLLGFDNKQVKQFSLFGLNKAIERKVHVVYSGGDDMFIVGAWDELLELAVDIRRAFARFTNNKLSFSAGLALFSSGFPISKMAEITGMLESAAKSNNSNKNSIALFGFDTEQVNKESRLNCQHIYQWDEFTDKVCSEKLTFLMQHLDYNENDRQKLKAGKTMLYRLLNLLKEQQNEKMNLARFAYTLGRMQPEKEDAGKRECYNKFSEQMYKWFKDAESRKQLRTALNLLIYYLRDTKENA